MLVCPDCREGPLDLAGNGCELCGWKLERDDGVPGLLSTRDRLSRILSAYTDLYEVIAGDDLENPIQGDDLLAIEADRLLDELGEVRDCRICEVGVGRGMLFERLAAGSPARLVGVDLSLTYLRRFGGDAGRGVGVVRANAENLPFREEFDLIVASDVLEHVLNAADFLSTANEALRPDGRFVVKVPYREDISQYRSTSGCPYPFVHLRTFNRPLLEEMLENAGFEVESTSYSGFFLDRWQRPLRISKHARMLVEHELRRRFGENPGVNRINPRLGRLLMRPTVITVRASKRRPALPPERADVHEAPGAEAGEALSREGVS